MSEPYGEGQASVIISEHISPRKTGDNIEAKRTAGYVFNPSTLEWQRDTNTNIITSEQIYKVLQDIRDGITMPVYYDEPTNANRVLSAGGTLSTVSTVTTVGTVSNQTNIGGQSADTMMESTSYQDWGLAIRSNLI